MQITRKWKDMGGGRGGLERKYSAMNKERNEHPAVVAKEKVPQRV